MLGGRKIKQRTLCEVKVWWGGVAQRRGGAEVEEGNGGLVEVAKRKARKNTATAKT